MGLFCLFLKAIKVTDLLEVIKSALLAGVISYLRLLDSLLAFTFFLVCCYFRTASMEPIEFIFVDDG